MAYKCMGCGNRVTGVCQACYGGGARKRGIAAAGGNSRTRRAQQTATNGRERRATGDTRRGFWRWLAG